MLTISKPLSAGQAQTYHKEEFANAEENYYSEGDRIRGEWHGRLAQEWRLRGEVEEEHFQRLANGQHPLTEEQLVRHQTAREYINARGETVSTMEHRAAWDATFSAPKSVSLTALVGGDEAVRHAHRESVKVAHLHEDVPFQSVDEILERRRGGDLFRYLLEKFATYSGISGVQPKILVRDEKAFAEMEHSGLWSTSLHTSGTPKCVSLAAVPTEHPC
jgi:TrwC relaxase